MFSLINLLKTSLDINCFSLFIHSLCHWSILIFFFFLFRFNLIFLCQLLKVKTSSTHFGSSFLKLQFLRSTLAASHKFCYVYIFTEIIIFHILGVFLDLSFLFDFQFTWWAQNIPCIFEIILNCGGLVLWMSTWSILMNVLCA